MRKQLGIFASVLLLSTMALFWSGCSDRCCDADPCQPVCELPSKSVCAPACQPACPPPACAPAPKCAPVCAPAPACAPKPACAPACAPKPACAPAPACAPKPACVPTPAPCPEPLCKKLPRCNHPNQAELACHDGITVRARNPGMCMLGDNYTLEFDIHACKDVCDVVVTTHLPEGVTFIKSTPEAKADGQKLTWYVGPMRQGQCINAKVQLKCECEGELCACFCATATPVRFCSLLCAKPVLTCEKCGPEQVCPGDTINYTITVTNRGSCTAEDVVVTDNLPAGVEHASCQKTIVAKLGNLAPCETKKINICAKAVQRGKVTNNVVVTACNADSTSCQWTTCICCCGVDLVKNGPKEVAIGKNADYTITVTNTGDLPLTEVVVADNAPAATSIVAAQGATVNGNQAVWRLKELKAGEKVNFNITLTTCVPGCHTNRVSVDNCQHCTDCAEFTTRWKGRPALCVTTCEEGPICVGETTSYKITVLNQGSEADAGVVVTLKFPEELQPIGGTGPTNAQVSGQTVTFAPLGAIAARQTIEYRVDARGKKSGDGRINVEVSSEAFKQPITQQESTIVN